MKYTSKFESEEELTRFLSNRYKYLREDVSKTQEEWAELLEVSTTHISNLEMQKYRSSVWLLLKVCDIMDLSVDELLRVTRKASKSNDEIDDFLETLTNSQLDTLYTFIRKLEKRIKK